MIARCQKYLEKKNENTVREHPTFIKVDFQKKKILKNENF